MPPRKKPPAAAEQVPAGPERIAEELLPLARRIDAFALDPRNARKHPVRNLAGIKTSLQMHGQLKCIVVDPDGVVLAGNGTLLAARELGWKRLAAVRYAGPKKSLRAFALQDNRTAELAEWDYGVALDTIQELVAEGVDINDLGWDPREISLMEFTGGDADPTREWEGAPPMNQGDATGFALIVRFKTQAEKVAFGKIVEQSVTPATRSIWYPFVEPDRTTNLRVVGAEEPAKSTPAPPPACKGCGKPLDLPANQRIADGCPCNTPRGVNHGRVPKDVCTCLACDPEETGCSRAPFPDELRPDDDLRERVGIDAVEGGADQGGAPGAAAAAGSAPEQPEGGQPS